MDDLFAPKEFTLEQWIEELERQIREDEYNLGNPNLTGIARKMKLLMMDRDKQKLAMLKDYATVISE